MKLKLLTLLAATAAALTMAAEAETKSEDLPGVAAQPASYFYTGKPYDADLHAYVYNYRNFDVELNRWASADPTGFPDGSNNWIYACNTPSSMIDPNGLVGKSILWVFGWSGFPEYHPNGDPWMNDDDDADLVANEQTQWKSQLSTWDGGDPSPEYLSDGDLFDWRVIGSPSELSGFSDWDRVLLVAHGRFSVTNGSEWAIGGQIYTTGQINSYRSDVELFGCGWSLSDPGGVDFFSTYAEWQGITETYLYE